MRSILCRAMSLKLSRLCAFTVNVEIWTLLNFTKFACVPPKIPQSPGGWALLTLPLWNKIGASVWYYTSFGSFPRELALNPKTILPLEPICLWIRQVTWSREAEFQGWKWMKFGIGKKELQSSSRWIWIKACDQLLRGVPSRNAVPACDPRASESEWRRGSRSDWAIWQGGLGQFPEIVQP